MHSATAPSIPHKRITFFSFFLAAFLVAGTLHLTTGHKVYHIVPIIAGVSLIWARTLTHPSPRYPKLTLTLASLTIPYFSLLLTPWLGLLLADPALRDHVFTHPWPFAKKAVLFSHAAFAASAILLIPCAAITSLCCQRYAKRYTAFLLQQQEHKNNKVE